ncbi:MAG TPA: chemotaxis protein CheW [Gammaproteobacteria bacterium]|nr:chemotaxis protein CheW [Gammaproteobacteria bacterium]
MSDPVKGVEVPEWLPPSAALTRFQPGDTEPALGGAMYLEQLRYGVRVGALRILLPENSVSEVLDRPEIFPLPNTTSWFDGLINLRGNVVPVFDLRELFGTAPIAGERQMLLVIDKGENALGIAIDGLPVPAPDSAPLDKRPSLPGVLENHTGAVFEHNEDLWLEVDIPGLVRSLSNEIAA